MKKGLTTEKTFAMWIIGLFIGYVWATFFKNAPFDAFAYAFTGGLTAIVGKRLIQRRLDYGGNKGCNEHED